MNKRIKELYLQARNAAWNEPIDLKNCSVEDIKGISQQVYEKFAELIVRECAGKVDWILAEGGGTQGDLIREHFGVEE
jgi:hypothetical protein